MAIVDSVACGMSDREFGRDLSTAKANLKTQVVSSLMQIRNSKPGQYFILMVIQILRLLQQ